MSADKIIRRINGEDVVLSAAEATALRKEWAESLRESRLAMIRIERDARLAASDWTQQPDAPVDAKAWAEYRQALRDLPAKIEDPTVEVEWPEPPK